MDQYPSQTAITNNEILTALAGILFFGPFITPFHKENHGEGQSSFVYPYLNVGKLNLILFAITVFFFIINYFAQTTVLQRLASWTAILICLISAFCITACLNEIALPAILPPLWPYPTIKDITLRPYTLCKNLLSRMLNKWKKSEPFLQ